MALIPLEETESPQLVVLVVLETQVRLLEPQLLALVVVVVVETTMSAVPLELAVVVLVAAQLGHLGLVRQTLVEVAVVRVTLEAQAETEVQAWLLFACRVGFLSPKAQATQ